MKKLRTIGQKLRPDYPTKLRAAAKVADRFYSSLEWRALVESEYAKRFVSKERARCQDLRCEQRLATRGTRLFADHIVELRDGGNPLDPTNILFRCGSCHTRKTAEERAKRMHARPLGGIVL